ncbi:hypothetical protein DFH06DRAFT_1154065 [Mycena polygramma]|nr:hypothetical protein DFH06DRAFT_1154065 [Mycena polygramma]
MQSRLSPSRGIRGSAATHCGISRTFPLPASPSAELFYSRWSGTCLRTAGLRILLAPGYFPNLKQISFVRIPGLEKLEFSLKFIALSPSHILFLQKIPTLAGGHSRHSGKHSPFSLQSSPLLQTLRFRLEIKPEHYYNAQDDTMGFLWEAYSQLVKKTNEMRFSALTSVELSVKLSRLFGQHSAPRTNLMPLLLGNSTLMDIGLDVEEADAHPGRCCLRHQFPTPLLFHRLCRTILFSTQFWPDDPPFDFQAFPNVTHLDSAYTEHFVALPRLEYLRMYRSISIESEHWNKPPTVIFPAQEYVAKMNETLAPLPSATRRGSSSSGCPTCCGESWDSLLPYWVEYRFCRELGRTEFALVEKQIREV